MFAPSSALTLCSWNTRALFSSYSTSSPLASQRYKQMYGLVGRFDAVCLQETHGTESDAEMLQRDDRCRNSIVHSSMIDPSAGGGVVTVLSSKLASQFDSITPYPLIAGRILASHLKGRRGDLVIVNVHMPNTSDPVAMYRRYLSVIQAFLPLAAHTRA